MARAQELGSGRETAHAKGFRERQIAYFAAGHTQGVQDIFGVFPKPRHASPRRWGVGRVEGPSNERHFTAPRPDASPHKRG